MKKEKIMKISFNVLKYNQFSKEPLEVDELSFWRYYLEILQVKGGNFLNNKELEVVAYVLAGDPGKSYFVKPYSEEIMETFDLSVPYYRKIKYELRDKGIIVATKKRGHFVLNPRLADYQKEIKRYLEEGIEIEYLFKFKKGKDDSNESTKE